MSDKKRLIKSVVLGALCGLLAGVILMCALAAFMLTGGLLPPSLTEYAAVAVAAIGTLVGAFVAVKCNRGAALTVGALTAAVMFILLTVTSLCCGDKAFTALTAIRFGAMLLGGTLGGVLAVRRKAV